MFKPTPTTVREKTSMLDAPATQLIHISRVRCQCHSATGPRTPCTPGGGCRRAHLWVARALCPPWRPSASWWSPRPSRWSLRLPRGRARRSVPGPAVWARPSAAVCVPAEARCAPAELPAVASACSPRCTACSDASPSRCSGAFSSYVFRPWNDSKSPFTHAAIFHAISIRFCVQNLSQPTPHGFLVA